MAEEKKELESSEEDEKTGSEAEKSEAEKDKKSEEEGSEEEKKDDFEKEKDVVPSSKYNQAIRKAREAELEKRELEKQLAEARKAKPEAKEEEDDDFFKKEEEDEDEDDKKSPDQTLKIVEEKLKPIADRLNKREAEERKTDRSRFFEAHPEYLNNSEKWQELLDEMEISINPNSSDPYYTQLEKTHRILAGESYNAEVENKKAEMANEAASGGDGAEKGAAKEEFTPEDRKYMKDFNVSEDGMRAYKRKIASGEMQILS